MGIMTGEATGFQENQGKIASPEYPSVLTQQPPVQYGERTGFQAIITSSWVLRWAAMPTTYAHYRQIRKHPTIALARILCAAPVLAAEWSVKAHDGARPEWVRLIQDTFMPMRERFLEPALLFGNIDFGYQGFEMVFDQADGYDKLINLKPLLQDITEICIGHRGEFLGFRQWGTELGLANALHVGFRIEGSYLYGIPLLENIRETHRDWVECNEGAKRYDKHVAGAHWIVHYPDILVTHNGVKNVPAGVVAREILNTLESAGGAAVPRDVAAFMQQLGTNDPGWLIELKATGTQEQAGFVDRLNYLDKLLCRGLLLPERSVLEGTHGTKEEAETHLDAAMVTKDLEHRYCTAELNRQAVDEVLVLNFGPEAKGQVELEAAPIVDSKREFFKDLYMQVLANPQAAVAEFNKMDFDAIRDALGIPKAKETDKPNIPEPYGMEPYGQNGRGEIPPEGDDQGGYGGNGGNGGGTGPQSLMMGNRMRTRMPRRFSNEPLELAGSEPVEQESWQEDPRFTHGVLGFKRKSVQLGDHDWLNFEGLENREDDDPDVAEIVSAHGLSHPHEVLWSRGPEKGGEVAGGRFDVTGEGKAGQMVSHATHALRELVDRYKPVSIEFSGHELSRQKVYHRMMRRMAEGNVGGGEYVFLHEPGRSFRARGGNIIHEPAYFHIVHQAAADLPRYRDMEEIGAREKVAMGNRSYRILRKMRARRGARFANEPPEAAGGDDGFSMNPQQQADVHALTQVLGKSGGEATANMMITSGRWRADPPHSEGSEHANRAAEAIANAVKSGAIRPHPEKKKIGRTLYIPGESFDRFNHPMQNPPGKRFTTAGGQRRPATEPPSSESAKFIEQAGLHPHQLVDLQTLAALTQKEGGRIGGGRIDELRGKWRSTPPHVADEQFKNRYQEARGLALKHAMFVVEPESGKYVPGPNYRHFLPAGEEPVAPPPYVRHPSARRPLAERQANPIPLHRKSTRKPREAPPPIVPIETGVESMVANVPLPRFQEVMKQVAPPEGIQIKPEEARDMLSLMEVLDKRGGKAGMAAFQKDRQRSLWTNTPRDLESTQPTHLHDILAKMVQQGVLVRQDRSRANMPLDLTVRKKAYDFAKEQPGATYSAIARAIGVDKATVRQWFARTPQWQTWTPESHVARSPGASIASTFTYANSPAHDYLRQLQKSVDANRKSARVKVPQTGSPNEPAPKTDKGKVLQADRKFIQQVSKAFDEATKAKKIALPEGHDWQSPIFDAVLRQPIAPTDRQEVISRVGDTMLDKISKYNKLKGPFVPWFTKELNDAARTATEDYKAETAGQIPGNVSIDAPISDDATRADIMKDTKEVLPGQGLYQPENRRLVTRSRAMSMLDREWDKPLTRATLRVVERDAGPIGATLLKTMSLNPQQEKVFELFNPAGVGEAAAAARYKQTAEKVLQSLRDHLGTGDDQDQRLLDLFEVSLHTKRTRDKPVYMSNTKKRSRKIVPTEEHPEELLFD